MTIAKVTKEAVVEVVEGAFLKCPECGSLLQHPNGSNLIWAEDWDSLQLPLVCDSCGTASEVPAYPFKDLCGYMTTECECDSTHESNDTVCRWCWAHGRRHWDDPDVS